MCGGQGQLLGIGSLPSTLLRWESLVLSFASFQVSWPELLDDSPVTVFHPAVQTLRLQVHTTTYGLQMRITTSGLQIDAHHHIWIADAHHIWIADMHIWITDAQPRIWPSVWVLEI